MMDSLAALDLSIFRAVNGLCGWSPTLDRTIAHLEELKGSLFMGIFGLLWYQSDKQQIERREKLLTIVLAVAVALITNRLISTLLPFRIRPMYGIGANAPTFDWRPDLENWSSFPSDNATFLFAVAAGLWLVARWWGLLFGVFAAFASTARVYLGIHYPSDILVGALLGIAVTLAINRQTVRQCIAEPILGFEPRHTSYFYGLLFVVFSEFFSGFPIARRIGVAVVHLFVGYRV